MAFISGRDILFKALDQAGLEPGTRKNGRTKQKQQQQIVRDWNLEECQEQLFAHTHRVHWNIWPLLATAAVTRTLMKSPDIAINKTSEKKPYERYLEEDGRHVQYKLFTTLDYNRMKPDPDRPKLWKARGGHSSRWSYTFRPLLKINFPCKTIDSWACISVSQLFGKKTWKFENWSKPNPIYLRATSRENR